MPKERTQRTKASTAPYAAAKDKEGAKGKVAKKSDNNPLFESRPRNYSIGNDIPPKRDLTRFVKWPKYIKLQRQKRILMHRLKVPPSINQFTKTLDKVTAAQLFRLLLKYRPESKEDKKKRLLERAVEEKARKDVLRKEKADAAAKGEKPAEKKAATKEAPKKGKKPVNVKFGINHVTNLIEQKKAKLVVIAHDVDPIEIVLWLPALCRKLEVPYCIVKGKSRLGQVVRKKTATALALTEVHTEDKNEFVQLLAAVKENFNDKFEETRKQWGGLKLGPKSAAARAKRARLVAREEASRKHKPTESS